jgi:hypothetical protein
MSIVVLSFVAIWTEVKCRIKPSEATLAT